jgi:hypothetical protein
MKFNIEEIIKGIKYETNVFVSTTTLCTTVFMTE